MNSRRSRYAIGYDVEFNTAASPKGEKMFNRVAFVTGASRGIGRAIALTLCRSGFDIVVASPEIEKNEEVAAEIRACSGEAITINLDVTSPESVKAAFAKALQDKT